MPFDFARRTLRSCWRENFNTGLPSPVRTHVVAYFFDPLFSKPHPVSAMRSSAPAQHPANTGDVGLDSRTVGVVTTALPGIRKAPAGLRYAYGEPAADRLTRCVVGSGAPLAGRSQIPVATMAPPLLTAGWLHERLSAQLRARRSARTVLNNAIAELGGVVHDNPAGGLLGVRLTVNGRLGKQKKGMAQALSRSLGRVPLSTLRSKIDYAQGFVITPLGTVGLKVWVCFL